MRISSIKPLAVTCFLAFSFAAVACSDDDDDDTTGTGGTGGSATAGKGGTGGSATAGKGGTGGSTSGSGSGGKAGSSGAAGAAGAAAGSAGAGEGGGGGQAAGSGGEGGGAVLGDIVDIAAGNPDFSSLVAAVQKAELVTALKGDGPLTVFAPTNAAFDALFDDLGVGLDDLSKEQLTPILTYHVVSGAVKAADVVDLTYATSLLGSDFRIKVEGGSVFLNGDTKVTATDILASNGVIHVIDHVLLPPGDITEVAAANDSFDSLVAALTKADLIETLQGDGPFTVFAPTDAAFDEFLSDQGVTLDDLSAEALRPILLYHVVPGKLYSEDVVEATSATTVEGSDVTIAVTGSTVTLGDSTEETASVTAVDVLASNGVIHVIDKVLVP